MKRPVALTIAGVALGGWAVARALRTSHFSFAGRTVLITGGSRGLGLVLARQVCDGGGRVVLLARDQDELGRAHEELSARGCEVFVVACDLLDRAQTEAAVQRVVDQFGAIDVLINNAGIIEVGPIEHLAREDFERAMQLHFWAPFNLMMQIAPEMRRRGSGRIVNITSIGGKVAVPHLAAYCASKFALVGLSDALRAEWARDNIHITTVAPGMMRTGSHIQANFKGEHAAEFAWFAVSNSAPGISIKAERAAAQILNACRRGQSSLTITLAARAAIAGNALFPNLTGEAMKLANALLPRATDSSGDVLQSGEESRREKSPPRWMTHLSDRESKRNNEGADSPLW